MPRLIIALALLITPSMGYAEGMAGSPPSMRSIPSGPTGTPTPELTTPDGLEGLGREESDYSQGLPPPLVGGDGIAPPFGYFNICDIVRLDYCPERPGPGAPSSDLPS